jgi:SRSO17 transposase
MEINERRLELMLEESASAPSQKGVLVIDEHGDRKWGKKTAHVGRQWLANIGKTESGVVSVTSLLADERIYYPVDFEPYTPSHHFEGGKGDPAFRTKLKIASQLVELAMGRGISFRAVVADPFYGEDWGFKQSLEELGAGCVLALKPSHAWWHKVGQIGSTWEAAVAAGQAWEDQRHPGEWVKVKRHFRDGHEEVWWALELTWAPTVLKGSGDRLWPPPIPRSCHTKRRGTSPPTCLIPTPSALEKKVLSPRPTFWKSCGCTA